MTSLAYWLFVTSAEGDVHSYPADDWLRDTAHQDWPLITDQAEAVETARAILESEGWRQALVYQSSLDGTLLVATVTQHAVLRTGGAS